MRAGGGVSWPLICTPRAGMRPDGRAAAAACTPANCASPAAAGCACEGAGAGGAACGTRWLPPAAAAVMLPPAPLPATAAGRGRCPGRAVVGRAGCDACCCACPGCSRCCSIPSSSAKKKSAGRTSGPPPRTKPGPAGCARTSLLPLVASRCCCRGWPLLAAAAAAALTASASAAVLRLSRWPSSCCNARHSSCSCAARTARVARQQLRVHTDKVLA